MAGLELRIVARRFQYRQDRLAILAKGSYHKSVAAGGGAHLKIRGLKTGWSNDRRKRATRNDIYRFIEYFFDDRCL
jgi:hypothetical protein